ncbi:hypothetical protein Tco_0396580 [Tanacetum coccineum]
MESLGIIISPQESRRAASVASNAKMKPGVHNAQSLLHLDQLEKQLDKDEFQEDRSMAAFWASLFNDKWRLLTTLHASLLKEKKGLRCCIFLLQPPVSPPTRLMGFIVSTYDEYFKPPPYVDHPVPEVPTLVPAASTSSPSSTTIDQDAPSTSTSQTTSEQQSSVIP